MSNSAPNDYCDHCAAHADACACAHCDCGEWIALDGNPDASSWCAECEETACECNDCTNVGTPEEVRYDADRNVRACADCRAKFTDHPREREADRADYLYDLERDAKLNCGGL